MPGHRNSITFGVKLGDEEIFLAGFGGNIFLKER